MRYRRLSCSYSEVVAVPGPDLYGDPWNVQQRVVVAGPRWRPPADLYETATSFVATIEVAGMAEEAFEVTLYEDMLVVEGQRASQPPEGIARFHAAEIHYGPFRLVVPLPAPVDRDRVAASYERGFLQVTLPKVERGKR